MVLLDCLFFAHAGVNGLLLLAFFWSWLGFGHLGFFEYILVWLFGDGLDDLVEFDSVAGHDFQILKQFGFFIFSEVGELTQINTVTSQNEAFGVLLKIGSSE